LNNVHIQPPDFPIKNSQTILNAAEERWPFALEYGE